VFEIKSGYYLTVIALELTIYLILSIVWFTFASNFLGKVIMIVMIIAMSIAFLAFFINNVGKVADLRLERKLLNTQIVITTVFIIYGLLLLILTLI
jgi:hypothetical protein